MRRPRLFDMEDEGELEHNQVSYLQTHVEPGDDVIVIGGGRGITATMAAKRAAPGGSVLVYEADIDMANKCRETIDLNKTSDIVEIVEQPVGDIGKTAEIMGFDANTNSLDPVSPSGLPECDVMEIDCEGAEQDILPNLNVRPRILILEIHPSAGYTISDAETDLNELGYVITDWSKEDKNVPVVLAEKAP